MFIWEKAKVLLESEQNNQDESSTLNCCHSIDCVLAAACPCQCYLPAKIKP